MATQAATAKPDATPRVIIIMTPDAPPDDEEEQDHEEKEEEEEEEEAMEIDIDISSIASSSSSITGSSSTTGSSNQSRRRQKRGSSLPPTTTASKRIALAVEAMDVTKKDLAAFVKAHVLAPGLAEQGGWKRVKPPQSNPHRSIAWEHCACYEKDGQRRWYCHTTEACRDRDVCIITKTASSSNVTSHLRDCHGMESARSIAMHFKKAASEKELRVATTEKANMVQTGGVSAGHRFDRLKFVKNVSVGTFMPFNYMENPHVRQHYKSLNPDFPVESLHHKNIRHHICELHSATHQALKATLATITSRTLPSLSIFIDIWEDKFCSKKFLGLRIRWIDDMWLPQTRLLALRGFDPSSQLRDAHQVSGLLSLWVHSCLDDYGLNR